MTKKRNIPSQEESRDRDSFFMQQALDLALKGRGRVSPNPLVGCVIVDAHGHRIVAGFFNWCWSLPVLVRNRASMVVEL